MSWRVSSNHVAKMSESMDGTAKKTGQTVENEPTEAIATAESMRRQSKAALEILKQARRLRATAKQKKSPPLITVPTII